MDFQLRQAPHQFNFAAPQPPPNPLVASPGKKPNFWQSLLPSVGGIGGGVAGGAAGGALAGTAILPGVGTAAGGLIGALLGGAGGGAAGKVAENKLTGQALGNGVAGQAVEQGVLSAGPLRLAKAGVGLAKGGAALASGLSNTGAVGADIAGNTAANAGQSVLKTSTAGRLQSAGNKLLASQYGTISKPVARATNPLETIGKLADFGLTKPQDVERISNAITGSSGLINKAVVKSVGNAGQVNTDGLGQILSDAIENNGLVSKDAKSVQQIWNAQSKKLMGGPAGSLSGNANPTDTFEVMKNLEKRAMDLLGKGSNYRLTTPERTDQAHALLTMRDELGSRLFDTAGASGNINKVLTPELRQQLLDLHPNNGKWQNFVDKTVMKAKSIEDLRGAQAPFVRGSKILNEADINNMTFGGRVGNLAGGDNFHPLQLATKAAVGVLKGPGSRIAGSALRTAGGTAGAVGGGAAGAANPFTLGKVAARVAPVGLAGALLDQGKNTLAGTQLPGGQSDGQPPIDTAGMQNVAGQQLMQVSPVNPAFDPANLEGNVQKILAAGGTAKDAQEYVQLAGQVNSLRSQSLKDQLALRPNSTQQQQQFNAQSGLQSLQTIADTLQNNPNAAKLSGLPGGSLTHALTGTGEYSAAVNNAADVIGRLRSGGAINADEEKRFKTLLPSSFDSPETVQYKLASLQNLFQQFANPVPGIQDSSAGNGYATAVQ